MIARLCQLKTLMIFTLLIAGCGLMEAKNDADTELLSKIEEKPSTQNSEYEWKNLQGDTLAHGFFAVENNINQTGNQINVLALSAADSDLYYLLDLQSGQRYFDHQLCKTKDVWNKYSGTLGAPPFTIAVIPGMLDLLGGPQKVIIFGGEHKFKTLLDVNYTKVQLVGSVVQQVCVEGNCLGKKNWPSRLIFIGVDPADEKFGQVKNIAELKEKINPEEVKAYLENMEGINRMGSKEFPAASVGEFLDFSASFSFQKKYSIFINQAEKEKMTKTCHALYEKMWNDVGVQTVFDTASNSVDELKAKLKVRLELKRAGVPVQFNERLKNFTIKYYQPFVTCMKFVRFPSVNEAPEKFWFLSDIGIFYLLHSDGHYFDCQRKSWGRNTLNNRGELIYSLKDGIAECTTRDIDMAFNYLQTYLVGLRNSEKFYYKFLDYDSHTHGTHAKIYSWIKMRKFESSCESPINDQVLQKGLVTPADHKWKVRETNEKSNDMDVIL